MKDKVERFLGFVIDLALYVIMLTFLLVACGYALELGQYIASKF